MFLDKWHFIWKQLKCTFQILYSKAIDDEDFDLLSAQLLTRDPACRLGCMDRDGGEEAITVHPFFTGLDWEKLNRREIAPPFTPRIVSLHRHFCFILCVLCHICIVPFMTATDRDFIHIEYSRTIFILITDFWINKCTLKYNCWILFFIECTH